MTTKKQRVYLVTGVTGSDRIELLREFAEFAQSNGHVVKVYDIGDEIKKNAIKNDIPFVVDKILNLDSSVLGLLRTLAIRDIQEEMKNDDAEIIFIGMHALFVWKDSLIPGVSYRDLMNLKIDGVINVTDDIRNIFNKNKCHVKYNGKYPSAVSVQRWMMEEELLSGIFANIVGKRMYIHTKAQGPESLYDFFFTDKKRVYLSYPITSIRKEDPKLLEQITNEYKPRIQELFYVFNPLDIQDKGDISVDEKIQVLKNEGNEELLEKENVEMIDARTITRDFHFIDQADAVVVLYPTDFNSSGVAAEIEYAYRSQKPVFMFFTGSVSPFLKEKASIYTSFEDLFTALQTFQNHPTASEAECLECLASKKEGKQ